MTRSNLAVTIVLALGVLALGVAGLLASCSSEGGTLTKEQALENSRVMMNKLGAAAEANRDNCEGFAEAVKKIIAEHRHVAKQVEALKKDPATREWFETEARKLMSEIGPKLGAMMELGLKCKGNEKWKQVNDELKGVMQ